MALPHSRGMSEGSMVLSALLSPCQGAPLSTSPSPWVAQGHSPGGWLCGTPNQLAALRVPLSSSVSVIRDPNHLWKILVILVGDTEKTPRIHEEGGEAVGTL